MPTPDPTHPDFPHGEVKGYRSGCLSDAPCPATPTCAEAHAAEQREYRRRRRQAAGPDSGRMMIYVRARLAETLAVTSIPSLEARSGITGDRIEGIRDNTDRIRLDAPTALALDAAWAWFTKGVDVLAPDFRHGRNSSYVHGGCRCGDCTAAANRERKASRLGLRRPGSSTISGPDLTRHVRALVRAAGSHNIVSDLVGVDRKALRALSEDPSHRIRPATADRLYAWTPEKIARTRDEQIQVTTSHGSRVNAARAAWMMGTLGALGYPAVWVRKYAGISPSAPRFSADRNTTLATMRCMNRAFRVLSTRPADPERDGIDPYVVALTKDRATKAGFYPPQFYDDQGNLNPRFIPDHPWTKLDEFADMLLQAAHLLATTIDSQTGIAARVGTHGKKVGEVAKAIGIVYKSDETGGARDYAASAPAIARVREVFGAYEDGLVGPVEAALTLGLHDRLRKTATKEMLDHPEFAAWRDAQAKATNTHDAEEAKAA